MVPVRLVVVGRQSLGESARGALAEGAARHVGEPDSAGGVLGDLTDDRPHDRAAGGGLLLPDGPRHRGIADGPAVLPGRAAHGAASLGGQGLQPLGDGHVRLGVGRGGTEQLHGLLYRMGGQPAVASVPVGCPGRSYCPGGGVAEGGAVPRGPELLSGGVDPADGLHARAGRAS